MTFCVENETEKELPFDVEEVAGKVMEAALEQEGCPYEASIELLLTDNEGSGTRELYMWSWSEWMFEERK